MAIQDNRYKDINRFIAGCYFGVKHPNSYVKRTRGIYDRCYRKNFTCPFRSRISERVDFSRSTALAIQIDHRESYDLDFMKWNFKGDYSVDWPVIRKKLTAIFDSEPEMNLLEHDQVQLFVNGVMLSFFYGRLPESIKRRSSVHG